MAGGDLSARAESLEASVRQNTAAVIDLVRRTRWNRRAIWVAFASIAIDVVLTVVGVVAVARFIAAERAQNEDRDQLCALYELILEADTPQRRAAMDADELAGYERAVDVIAEGFDALGCERGVER